MWAVSSAVVIYENIGRVILRLKPLPVFFAFDVLIMFTAVALGLFRWWHWQDGRPSRDVSSTPLLSP
jgi:hypothetical protein